MLSEREYICASLVSGLFALQNTKRSPGGGGMGGGNDTESKDMRIQIKPDCLDSAPSSLSPKCTQIAKCFPSLPSPKTNL